MKTILPLATVAIYAANIEKAEALAPSNDETADPQPLQEVSTPDQKSIDQVSQFLSVGKEQNRKDTYC